MPSLFPSLLAVGYYATWPEMIRQTEVDLSRVSRAPTGTALILSEQGLPAKLSGLGELRSQFAQQHFSLKYFADDVVGLVTCQA